MRHRNADRRAEHDRRNRPKAPPPRPEREQAGDENRDQPRVRHRDQGQPTRGSANGHAEPDARARDDVEREMAHARRRRRGGQRRIARPAREPAHERRGRARDEETAGDRMRAGLMRPEIDVPAGGRQDQIDVRRQGARRSPRPRGRAAVAVPLSTERDHGAAGDDVRAAGPCRSSAQAARDRGSCLLRVPVAVEVVPVLRMRAEARAQLIGELLRRAAIASSRGRSVRRRSARRSGRGSGRGRFVR